MGISAKCATVSVSMRIASLTVGQLKLDQETDSVIGQIIQYKLAETKPSGSELKQLCPQVVCLIREWDKLQFDDRGVLCRQMTIRKQLVLPAKHGSTVLKELHDEMGHHDVKRTTSLLWDRFYRPFVQTEIEDYVKRKYMCLKNKRPSHETKAPLTNVVTTQPFELVSVDFLHLDRCKGGYEYVLVIVDHFTCFAQAYATTNKSGKTAADKIFNDYALKFGFP